MNALRRLWAIPGIIGGLWIAQLLVAAAFGAMVVSSVRAAMTSFTVLDDGHLLSYLGFLLADNPSVGSAVVAAVAGSSVLSLLLWTAAAGGVFTRLAGKPGFLPACGQWLPGIIATSLWHLLMRGVILLAVFLGVAPLPGPVAIPIALAAITFCTCSLDVARAHVVLHGAPPNHPKTAARAFLQAANHPVVLLQSVGLSLVQWVCVGVALYVSVAGMDDGSGVVGARLLSLGALIAGLWRIAVVVDAGEMPTRAHKRKP